MPATSHHCEKCSLCEGKLELVLELSPTPPANEILPTFDKDKELYPLNLMRCAGCSHLQLDTEISMFRLFKHYVYTSNTSSQNLNYLHGYAAQMEKKFNPKFVVDIGSNDGTFLHFFSCRRLGVDPAENIVEIALQNNVDTKCAFFNELTATDIANKYGKADLITCNNMFAHNRNLGEVLLGIKKLLSDNGSFVFEVSYAMKLLENNLFDLIYHEHFHHHHITPLVEYLKKFDLQIYDAEIISQTHGGSIRIYAQHGYKINNRSGRLKNLLLQEKYFDSLVNKFKSEVPEIKKAVVEKINELVKEGKQVSVLGYPAKACTLSYYFGLTPDLITSVYDNNPLKIGKFTHNGMRIKPETDIYRDKPDYLLMLSWNYKKELIEKHALFRKAGGKFIIPFPDLKVI